MRYLSPESSMSASRRLRPVPFHLAAGTLADGTPPSRYRYRLGHRTYRLTQSTGRQESAAAVGTNRYAPAALRRQGSKYPSPSAILSPCRAADSIPSRSPDHPIARDESRLPRVIVFSCRVVTFTRWLAVFRARIETRLSQWLLRAASAFRDSLKRPFATI
jgi:hypothetical protein